MNATAIRLVFSSRRRLMRDVMCAYLAQQPEFTVVGQTDAIDALPQLCRLRRPDVALVDISELTASVAEKLLRTCATAPGVAVVVCYTQATSEALRTAARAVAALIPAAHGLDAILKRVREVGQGTHRDQVEDLSLTEYESRILSLLSDGHSVAEMAQLLGVSTRTVENHKRRLYEKLGANNPVHAVSRGMSLGLIHPVRTEDSARWARTHGHPLVIIRGVPGPSMDAVHRALLRADIPFVNAHTAARLDNEHWVMWHRGPFIVVLVDPSLPDWATVVSGAHRIVVLSQDPDVSSIADMLLRGANALVRSTDVGQDLTAVVSLVVSGYLAIGAQYVDEIGLRMIRPCANGPPSLPAITPRERDILSSMMTGHTIRQTARLLGIAAKTVENTQARLYRKLGARNRTEALAIARRLGLLHSSRR